MSITFNNPSKSTKTVNKLLSRVLPGYTTENSSSSSSFTGGGKKATSQQLTSSHNATTSHKIMKQQKKKQKNAVKISQEQRIKLVKEAKMRILKDHAKQGKLTHDEELELKKYVKKNVVDVQSWHNDDEDMEEVQREILELRGQRQTKQKKRSGADDKKLDVYKKDMIRYPGLTPGLAPVDAEDSEDSDDDFYRETPRRREKY